MTTTTADQGTTRSVWSATSSRRARRRTAAVIGAVVTAVALAACAVPVEPSPTVLPQPAGRGKVAGVSVAPSAGCTSGAGLPAGRTTVTFAWKGLARRALLDVPATGSGPRPVLLSLHPFTLTPEVWDAYSKLAAGGTARGYIVITPLGSDPGPRWAVPGGTRTGVDDIGFVNRLLDDVEDRGCVDRNREFAAGYSAGAAMSQALSCTVPWRMAAVAGSGGTNLTDRCPASPGTDVMVLHGTADPIAPVTGSTVPFATPNNVKVSDVVATNAGRAGCAPVPTSEQRYRTVRVDTYQGCGTHRVEYWQMQGNGHTWAGTPGILDLVVGTTNTDFSATTAVLDFFDRTAT